MTDAAYPLELLWELLALDSPSGDEGAIADLHSMVAMLVYLVNGLSENRHWGQP